MTNEVLRYSIISELIRLIGAESFTTPTQDLVSVAQRLEQYVTTGE